MSYTAYDAGDLVIVGREPIEVVTGTDAAVADAADGDISIIGTKAYKASRSGPQARMAVILQFTCGSDDFTIKSFDLEVWPFFEATADVNAEGAQFVVGVKKYDPQRGLYGETGLLSKFPTDLEGKTSAEPAPTIDETDDYVYCWMVEDIEPHDRPMNFRSHIVVTNDSGGSLNMALAMYAVGV